MCNKSKYNIFFLSIIIIAVLLASVTSGEYEDNCYKGVLRSTSAISNVSDDVSLLMSEESSITLVVKNVLNRIIGLSKSQGTRSLFVFSIISVISLCACMYAFFCYCIYKSILSSNRFIITYIHNLDGMKP